MTSILDRVVKLAAIVATVAATVVAILLLKREIAGTHTPSGTHEAMAPYLPRSVANWGDLAKEGRRIGERDARLTVLQFADFQCPACRQFALNVLRPLQERFPDDVEIIHRHWPLPYHPHAHLAARASECAASQGDFHSAYTWLYQHQGQLSDALVHAMGDSLRLPDPGMFRECLRADSIVELVDRDALAARQLGGTGTPTVLINGQLLAFVPDSAGLRKILAAVLAGSEGSSR